MEASDSRCTSMRCAMKSSGSPRATAPGTYGCSVPSHAGTITQEDLELLIEMDADRSLLDLMGLEQELEELLERRVDVVTHGSLHPQVRQRILADARPL